MAGRYFSDTNIALQSETQYLLKVFTHSQEGR